MKALRYWTVVTMLAATALLLQLRSHRDLIPPSEPLDQLPLLIAGMQGSEIPIDAEVREVLGAGDFLSRDYRGSGAAIPVGLFIGYFPTQRSGVTMHSPKNCLPDAGWVFESQEYIHLKDADGKVHRVGEYVIVKGEMRQVAIYWYQAHGRSVANEYMAKMYLIMDAMRMNRTDGALVRVSTPVAATESTEAAKTRAEAFTAQLAPLLPRYIPN
jgi:EpsI family protein